MLEYDEAELEVEKPIEIHWLKPMGLKERGGGYTLFPTAKGLME